MTWLALPLLLAAIGLLAVPSAPRLARFAAWLAVLAFAVGAVDPLWVAFAPTAARQQTVAPTAGPGAVLQAAAAAGPRASDLELAWQAPLGTAPGAGPLGASVRLPQPPLPVDPRRVQVRTLAAAAVGRPLAFEVEAPGLGGLANGELVLQHQGADVARVPFELAGHGVAACTWQPDAAGPHTLVCTVQFAGHRLVGRGSFDVAAAPRVVVLDPSGVAAAALQAQGLAVEAADQLPADWRDAAALVLGRSLPAEQQLAIVAAAIDGLGVFVLAPAFGGEGAPLRALLPLRPLPATDPAAGSGAGAAAVDPTPVPPTPPPVDERPPSGATGGAAPVARDPIEVDKRAIAMVLVVDRSGSMGSPLANGMTKMSYAKTSAWRTAAALGEGDQVGVVTFGNKGAGRVELPLTDATAVDAVRRGIERLAHGPEFTYLLSGLRLASELLAPSRAAVKHIVVVTDGEFDLSESVALQDQAMRLRTDARTTLSVVSIIDSGTEPSFKREAERLTRAGGGQFLPIEDASFVPVLVSAEVTRALQRVGREPADSGADGPPPHRPEPPPTEPPPPRSDNPAPPPPAAPTRFAVRAVAEDSPLLLPQVESWPSLGGVVPGTAPLDAQVLLVAGDAGWPLLAFGNRGLGRVGAFAADLGGPEGAEFRAEPAFPGRFAQWLQAVLPAAPVRAAAPRLDEVRVEPPAPTLRDVEWLAALTGGAVGEAPEPVPPALARTVESAAPRWALVALLAVLALAVCERYAGLWALRRGR
ncbi:MAG: VWA domain-containing protein [Planctomycetes bacterium]|nr:VWA domain-containing protein [Planctomycetota bacterium]